MTLEQLVTFLAEIIDPSEDVGAGTVLFSSGRMDSASMMNLIMFVEEKARIQVQAEDVTLENFDSPGQVMAYVESQG